MAERVAMAEELLAAGLIKDPDEYFNIINGEDPIHAIKKKAFRDEVAKVLAEDDKSE